MNASTARELKFKEVLTLLNPEQKAAVNTTYGPVLVVAGPGTGKTQVLSARIGQLLSNPDLQVNPSNILCLTFTDAGVVAMRKRLIEFMGPMAYHVSLHTFHSFCNEVISINKYFFRKQEMQAISELETMKLYEQLYRTIPADNIIRKFKEDAELHQIKRLRSLFDTMKKEHFTLQDFEALGEAYMKEVHESELFKYQVNRKPHQKGDPKVADIEKQQQMVNQLIAAAAYYETYQKLMFENNRYDFNDMILWVIDAFKNNPDLLLNYQERFQYILVDEFQDTSATQKEVVDLLTSYDESPNVFVVGDDDQSIYSFQGASLKNIEAFRSQFVNTENEIVLVKNYRSTSPILEASRALVENNKIRLNVDKHLVASNIKLQDLLEKPQVLSFDNVFQEEAYIVHQLEKIYAETHDLSNTAIIYRSHKTSDRLVDVLKSRNIPFNIKNPVNVLEVPFIMQLRSMMEYIHAEVNKPFSAENELFKILHFSMWNIPALDIAKVIQTKGYEGKLRELIANKKALSDIDLQEVDQIKHVSNCIEKWISAYYNQTPQCLFEMILIDSGLQNQILTAPDHNWNVEVLSTFFDVLKDESDKKVAFSFHDFFTMLNDLDNYNIKVPLHKIYTNDKGVNFMTAHGSKGLEFEHVFILGATSSNWEKKSSRENGYKIPKLGMLSNVNEKGKPVKDEDKQEHIEEERRLFYVAMTRAEKHLYITYANQKEGGGADVASQFVSELEGFVEARTMNDIDTSIIERYRLQSTLKTSSIKIDIINKDFIRQQLEKYVMSVTHLNKYLSCPVSFYFENILRVPSARSTYMGFGSAVHYALEMYLKELKDHRLSTYPPLSLLLSCFDAGMKKYHSHFTAEQKKNLEEHGRIALTSFYEEHYANANAQILDFLIEDSIKDLEIDGVPVNGKIDVIEKYANDKVVVIDYKTGKPENGKKKLNAPNEKDPNGGDYWRQMVFYKLLLDHDRKRQLHFEEGRFDFVEQNEQQQTVSYKVSVTPQDELIVRGQIKMVYDRIMNLEFSEGCGKKECTWCNFVKEQYKEGEFEVV
jgi:DNA helicase-2/ATP-dependent DNA helicase PcrA